MDLTYTPIEYNKFLFNCINSRNNVLCLLRLSLAFDFTRKPLLIFYYIFFLLTSCLDLYSSDCLLSHWRFPSSFEKRFQHESSNYDVVWAFLLCVHALCRSWDVFCRVSSYRVILTLVTSPMLTNYSIIQEDLRKCEGFFARCHTWRRAGVFIYFFFFLQMIASKL